MGTSTLRLVAISIIRAIVSLFLAWLVTHQLLDVDLANNAADVVAFLVVDRVWELYQAHRAELKRALYQRWLVVLGLREKSIADPERQTLQARYVVEEARERTSAGLQP